VVDQALRERVTLDLVELSARFKTFSRTQVGEAVS